MWRLLLKRQPDNTYPIKWYWVLADIFASRKRYILICGINTPIPYSHFLCLSYNRSQYGWMQMHILNVNTSNTALICIFCSMRFKIRNHLILYHPIKSIYCIEFKSLNLSFKIELITRNSSRTSSCTPYGMKIFSCAKIPIRSTCYENSSHLIVYYVSELTLINSLLCFRYNSNWLKKSILSSFQLSTEPVLYFLRIYEWSLLYMDPNFLSFS